ncbi:MAG: DUF401 family protein [Desulfatiglans sp.]|jgi:integral membrane protein (TIGR00529 family)|nr:DUF401 family protein [Desulfatiglans sp.]
MILSLSALTKIISVFVLILLLNKLRLHLSLSLIVGSLALGLWMDLGALRLGESILKTLTSFQTFSLILIVGSILVISRLLKESGHLDRILESFGRISRDNRTVGSVMPALIGLLPMPGGALFSAPMVETAFAKNSVTREEQTMVNYWFRHMWEYWWPLYPGVVLAVALLDVEMWRFMLFMFPMTLVTAMTGAFFLLRPLGKMPAGHGGVVFFSAIRDFLWEIMPILVVILITIAVEGLAGLLSLVGFQINIGGAVSILPGLFASGIWILCTDHIPLKDLRTAVTDSHILPMLFLIVAIMVFKGVMTDSQAVVQVRNELEAFGIPAILIILITPFISGLITGIAIGFVGTSFPLIIPLFPSSPLFDYILYAGLAYTFGYMGMMLSPVHLCFLVTKDYFGASLIKSYRHLFKPAFTIMAVSTVIFLVLRIVVS